ncbi:MAG: YicC family protein [Opitutales bacterium]|nr:YicC family protein [Opitutales bacterium]MCH8540176.1 YicC family protein [Opitutales bacterium]
MTGYGRASGKIHSFAVVVELSSVNRKNLDLQINLPAFWKEGEREINQWLGEKVSRGTLVCQIHPETMASAETGPVLEASLLRPRLESFRKLCADLDIPCEMDARLLWEMANIAAETALPGWADIVEALRGIFDQAVKAFLESRQREGATLRKDLVKRVERLQSWLEEMEEESQITVPRYREMLLQRLAKMDLSWDPEDERVLREVAVFADRCDLTEELVRLRSHWELMAAYLDETEPVGRRSDFLLQEINREYHTIGSKANNVKISRLVLESKNECEKIREQIQNIE